MKKQAGFTLIELIIFIIFIGIIMPSMMSMLYIILKNTNAIQQENPAIESVNQCLESYLNKRYNLGYSSITCPSTTVPTFCSVPSGYTLSVAVTCLTKYSEVSSNYKQITVTVGGLGTATNTLIIANY